MKERNGGPECRRIGDPRHAVTPSRRHFLPLCLALLAGCAAPYHSDTKEGMADIYWHSSEKEDGVVLHYEGYNVKPFHGGVQFYDFGSGNLTWVFGDVVVEFEYYPSRPEKKWEPAQ